MSWRYFSVVPSLRTEERWAAECLEAALPGVEVKQNDDGSRASMYDLGLFREGELIGSCEVTIAADPALFKLWHKIHGNHPKPAGHGRRDQLGLPVPFAAPLQTDSAAAELLCEWLSEWLASPGQLHNIHKACDGGSEQNHLFVLLPGYTVAPFPARHLLTDQGGCLPGGNPSPPGALTHIWTMSTWSTGDLFGWSETAGWRRHRKVPLAAPIALAA